MSKLERAPVPSGGVGVLHAVVMAGGAGTRFWPASRRGHPKQLLQLSGERTMIQSTVARLGELVEPQHVKIITNQALVDTVARQLPQLPPGSIIGEPCKRDTAPCIGFAALLVHQADPEATMIVMPADHVIAPVEPFQAAVTQAATLVDEHPHCLVTFGIRPTYPAETFGYIERGPALTAATGPTAAATFQVRMFREKPAADVAQQYLDSGRFYWNSGIFVWKAQTILDALRDLEPQLLQHLETIAETFGSSRYADTLEREFAAIQGKSIDYAVLEHHPEVVVLEAPFDWDDVGNWQSVARLHGQDDSGNTVQAKHLGIETQGSIVHGPRDHLIVTVGLEDCIVVHTPDATLVARKDHEEALREIVPLLEEAGWEEYL